MSKDRIIVMNGSKLIESQKPDKSWDTKKVEPAGKLRAGIYNIFSAQDAGDKATQGMVVHADKDFVYQMVAQNRFVKHSSKKFEKVPDIGLNVAIESKNGKASTTTLSGSKTRSKGR